MDKSKSCMRSEQKFTFSLANDGASIESASGNQVASTINNYNGPHYYTQPRSPVSAADSPDEAMQKILDDFKIALQASYSSSEKTVRRSALNPEGMSLEKLFTPLTIVPNEKPDQDDHKSSKEAKDGSPATSDIVDDNEKATEDNAVNALPEHIEADDESTDQEDKKSSLRDIHNTHFERLRNPKAPVSLSDLMAIKKPTSASGDLLKSESAYRQILYGQAGVGKSTLCSFMAWDWVSSHEQCSQLQLAEQGYAWVFHLRMKELVQEHYKKHFTEEENPLLILARLVFDMCLSTKEKMNWYNRQKNVEIALAQLFEPQRSQGASNCRKVLWILDGLDEVMSYLNKDTMQSKVLNSLLSMPYIFVTARPCHNNLFSPDINIHRQLETVGFSDKQVAIYVEKYFSASKVPSQGKKCLEQLKQLQTTVWGVTRVPLLLQLLCIQYDNKTCHKNDSEEWRFHDNLADLYQGFIDGFFQYHDSKEKDKRHELVEFNQEENAAQQSFLKQLAFDGLKYEQVILPFQVIEETLQQVGMNTFDAIKRLGFLRPVDASFKKRNLYTHVAASYEFPHLTLQEYCAAWYAVDVINDLHHSTLEKREAVKKVLETYRYDMAWGWVWQFMFGIVSRTSQGATYENAKEVLWSILWQSPRDLLGTGHMHLVARCLEGALSSDSGFLQDAFCQQWIEFVIQHAMPPDNTLHKLWDTLQPLLPMLPQLRRALTSTLFDKGMRGYEDTLKLPLDNQRIRRRYPRNAYRYRQDFSDVLGFSQLIAWKGADCDVFKTKKADEWFIKLFHDTHPQYLGELLGLLKELGHQTYTPRLLMSLFALLREQPSLEGYLKLIFGNYVEAAKAHVFSLLESAPFLEEKSQDMDAAVRYWALQLWAGCIPEVDDQKRTGKAWIDQLTSFMTHKEGERVCGAAIDGLCAFKTTVYASMALKQLIFLWESSTTELTVKKMLEPAICSFMPEIARVFSRSLPALENTAANDVAEAQTRDTALLLEGILDILKVSMITPTDKLKWLKDWVNDPALRLALKPFMWKLVDIFLYPSSDGKLAVYLDRLYISDIQLVDFLLTVLTLTLGEALHMPVMDILLACFEKYYEDPGHKAASTDGFLKAILMKRATPYPDKAITAIIDSAWVHIRDLTQTLSQLTEKDRITSLNQLPVWLALVNDDVINVDKITTAKKMEDCFAVILPLINSILRQARFSYLKLQRYGNLALRRALFDSVLQAWYDEVLGNNFMGQTNNSLLTVWNQIMGSQDWQELLSREPVFLTEFCEQVSPQIITIYLQKEKRMLQSTAAHAQKNLLQIALDTIKKMVKNARFVSKIKSEDALKQRIIDALENVLKFVPLDQSTRRLHQSVADVIQELRGSAFCRVPSLVSSDPKQLIAKYQDELNSRYQTERLTGWEMLLDAYDVSGSECILAEMFSVIERNPGRDMQHLTRAIESSAIEINDEKTLLLWEGVFATALTAEQWRPLFALLKRVKITAWTVVAQQQLIDKVCALLPQARKTASSPEHNIVSVLSCWTPELSPFVLSDKVGEALLQSVPLPEIDFLYISDILLGLIREWSEKITIKQKLLWFEAACRQQSVIYHNVALHKAERSNLLHQLSRTIDNLEDALSLADMLVIINRITLEWEQEDNTSVIVWLSDEEEKRSSFFSDYEEAPEQSDMMIESEEENSDEADELDSDEFIEGEVWGSSEVEKSDDFGEFMAHDVLYIQHYRDNAATRFVRLLEARALSVVWDSDHCVLQCTLPTGCLKIDNLSPTILNAIQQRLANEVRGMTQPESRFFHKPAPKEQIKQDTSSCRKRKFTSHALPPPKRQRHSTRLSFFAGSSSNEVQCEEESLTAPVVTDETGKSAVKDPEKQGQCVCF